MPGAAAQRASDAELAFMKAIIDALIEHKDDNGNQIADVFMEIVSRRELPDYYRVIRSPIALVTIQNKLKQKRYTGFKDFIHDAARVFHNAKTYNRPSSQIYGDAVTLEGVLLSELQKLTKLDNPVLTKEEAILPDLGPLPTTESDEEDEDEAEAEAEAEVDDDSDSGGEEDEDGDGEEEEEEEDDDEDEDEEMEDADAAKDNEDEDEGDDADGTTRTRRSSRRVAKKVTGTEAGAEEKKKSKAPKKRGRPPRVDEPYECRIKAILKWIRKFKDEENKKTRHSAFEKLPDPKATPEYYRAVTDPIAIDGLKKKVKRRQYDKVEDFMADVNRMFDNAMDYYADDEQIVHDAQYLKDEASKCAEIELAKPDSDYADANSKGKDSGRSKVAFVDHKSDRFEVGDWVELANTQDANKPIVAQIFRTFKKPDDTLWLNVCWYYRPENTVHRTNKRFYENEVAKTGQYRDHPVEDILARCYVMFFTKASRGRPKNSAGKAIYICEARYNEDKKHFNKIKTWKSCIPDEIRSRGDDTEYWEKQVPLVKVGSPFLVDISDEARAKIPDTTAGDKKPEAIWEREDCPPRGAVYIGTRREQDSPSPEPTPPPRPRSPTPPPAPPAQAILQTQPRPSSTRRTAVVPPHQNSLQPTPMSHRQTIQFATGIQQQQQQPQLAPIPYVYPNHHAAPSTPQQQPFYQPVQQTPYQHPHPQYPQQVPMMEQQFHPVAPPQFSDGDRPDLPGEPFMYEVETDWPQELLDRLHCSDRGLPLFSEIPPQYPPDPVITFKSWGASFGAGNGVPTRDKKYWRVHYAALRVIQSKYWDIPFDEIQQRAWDHATEILAAFMARERAAGSTAMEDRSEDKAMIYPLEQAFGVIYDELAANGEELPYGLHPFPVVRHWRNVKRKREQEERETAEAQAQAQTEARVESEA
ncbi:hypothetical protein DRE_05438 [Drechslerella stenobrocha 248]|uniref:Chromatin structure-remodeling complex protein rsc1 n=1 Tax=Drechslerella stenobrocha 248 TaxID=1043628 RepID=W7I977_9PEZI|nr:hypothetical protein DRE_05438 [Drechslerella stenobrocha 248]